jgi:hypothetical protein
MEQKQRKGERLTPFALSAVGLKKIYGLALADGLQRAMAQDA